jgi:hypothetical protein
VADGKAGPKGKRHKNTKRTPREYEANTVATPEQHASNALASRSHRAWRWLAVPIRDRSSQTVSQGWDTNSTN